MSRRKSRHQGSGVSGQWSAGHSKFGSRRVLRHMSLCIMVYCLFGMAIFVPSVSCSLAAEPKAEPKNEEVKAKAGIGDFTYSAENRRNPFEPIFLLKVRQAREAFSTKKDYELDELKLVGILKADSKRFAMMEDTQGKGVLFKKGDFLHSNLWVSDILEDKVIFNSKMRGEVSRIAIEIPKK